ncbi:MAG: hypothetical protein ACRC41_10925 [Sarcina sp.]
MNEKLEKDLFRITISSITFTLVIAGVACYIGVYSNLLTILLVLSIASNVWNYYNRVKKIEEQNNK